MKKVLIVNLQSSGDFFIAAYVKDRIESRDNAIVEMLVYEKHAKLAELFFEPKNIHTIDTRKIKKLWTNPLFSKGFALNKLQADMETVASVRWDSVINISTDDLATLLVPTLKTEEIHGIYLDKTGVLNHSSQWAMFNNEIMSLANFQSPFRLADTVHNMLGITPEFDKFLARSIKRNDQVAEQHFSEIRKVINEAHSNTRIVAINVSDPSQRQNLNELEVTELISIMLDDPSLYPVIICSPNSSEFVEKLNISFDNSLVVIEAEEAALPSVLREIDMLVTPSGTVKQIANLCQVPMIELCLDSSAVHALGCLREGSLIVKYLSKERRGVPESRSLAHNVYHSARYYFFDTPTKILGQFTLYKVQADKLGLIDIPMIGQISWKKEILRLTSRIFSMKKIAGAYHIDLLSKLARFFSPVEIANFTTKEKKSLALILKNLLLTLKAIKELKHNSRSGRNFVKTLDNLLASEDQTLVSCIALGLFRAEIESLRSLSFDENVKDIERNLFQLKSDLQLVNDIMSDLVKLSSDASLKLDQSRNI